LERHGEPSHPSDLENNRYVVSYFSTRTRHSYPLAHHANDQTIELVGRYVVALNDGNAYLAAALLGMGKRRRPRSWSRSIWLPGRCGPCSPRGRPGRCRSMSSIRRTGT
jgi:LysR family transcriptional regulator, regulator for bpeEF and oprC